MIKYRPKEFEKKLIDYWEKNNIYKTRTKVAKNNKKYVLVMFPYPSGAGLHVGHVRVYTGTDVLARYFRMRGKNVLHPMGWDAFGLPAENAAIKEKKNPMEIVPRNIANFKRQMRMVGLSYDWDREFATIDPKYYKWTQWLFIQFYKMGLLYKKDTPINFCPFCKTGLAEEEVLPNGTHERCGNTIEKRDLPQWIFRITKYADRLLEDLDRLDWPRGIIEMQKNWIGRKEGINITYKVVDSASEFFIKRESHPSTSLEVTSKVKKIPNASSKYIYEITCFTTRPDTNFGATFVVIAPEHDFTKKILSGKIKVENEKLEEIKRYVQKSIAKSEIEREAEGRKKTGVFTGYYALNGLNGKKMPIWISDFVLVNVGTGAIVGVPGHDKRDFEFAKAYRIEILRVVVGKDGDTSPITQIEQVQEEEGKMINSSFLNGLDIHEATKKIMDYMENKGWGKRVASYHLRDWIFSRQRYWGEPIPMVECKKCGWVPVAEEDLPVELPKIKSYEPTGTGESPLVQVKEWVNTSCPNCGGAAKRETDTMPNWAGSCWYFLRFADPHNDKKAWDEDKLKNWLPVDWYIGGAEHAVLHLLYSRFWSKALYDLKLLDFSEPFLRLRNVGIVIAEDKRKMSKSFGNVLSPDPVVEEYGADTLRVYEMFMAPFDQGIAWSAKALQGAYRFLKRVWEIFQKFKVQSSKFKVAVDKKLVVKLQKTVAKVTDDIPKMKFNTAIAAMMEFMNEWESLIEKSKNSESEFFITRESPHSDSVGTVPSEVKKIPIASFVLSTENAKKFLQILAPFAPFITEEIWRNVFRENVSIHLSSWPKLDEKALIEEEVRIPVQVNGKVRTVISLTVSQLSEKSVIEKALEDEKVKKYIAGKKFQTIYVEGKIVNFVLI